MSGMEFAKTQTQFEKQLAQEEQNNENSETETTMSIAEKYPDGLNELIVEFSAAVYRIFVTDEIDKLLNHTEDYDEADALMELREYLSELKDVSEVPNWIILIQYFRKTPSLWADILANMVIHHEGNYTGEELERRLRYHITPDNDAEESDNNDARINMSEEGEI